MYSFVELSEAEMNSIDGGGIILTSILVAGGCLLVGFAVGYGLALLFG